MILYRQQKLCPFGNSCNISQMLDTTCSLKRREVNKKEDKRSGKKRRGDKRREEKRRGNKRKEEKR